MTVTEEDKTHDEKRPAKRPAKPKAEWIVPRGIAWVDADGVTIRVEAGGEVGSGIIPADLIDEYAGRGDIIKADTKNDGEH